MNKRQRKKAEKRYWEWKSNLVMILLDTSVVSIVQDLCAPGQMVDILKVMKALDEAYQSLTSFGAFGRLLNRKLIAG